MARSGLRTNTGYGALAASSAGSHRDLPGTSPLGLGHDDRQNPVQVVSGHLLAVHGIRQDERTLERAVAALIPVDPLVPLLGLLLFLTADGEDVVLERELDVLGLHTGKLRHNLHRVAVLEDVAGGVPGRGD